MAAQSPTPQVTSKDQAKAELKKLRAQQKAEKKNKKEARRGKKRFAAVRRFFGQLKQAYDLARNHDNNLPWWMALAFFATLGASLLVVGLLLNWVTGLLFGLPLALLAAMIVLSRKVRIASYARLEGQPGAAGAALSTLGRGWTYSEEPVAINYKSRDAVFQVVGKPGLILVFDGKPSKDAKKMVEKERKRFSGTLPGVPVHVINVGRGNAQVPLPELTKRIKKLDKAIPKQTITEVERRINAIRKKESPMPKGVDPFRIRPDRKAMKG